MMNAVEDCGEIVIGTITMHAIYYLGSEFDSSFDNKSFNTVINALNWKFVVF